ncbi:MAG: hypothetical protein M1816_000139 [Peltula sp. TS41687]|nr:MAG: hypothetical protein M1816_000139 [Peltula sp. TS41687]
MGFAQENLKPLQQAAGTINDTLEQEKRDPELRSVRIFRPNMNSIQPASGPTTTTSIYSLPNELIIHLLSYVPSRTLFHLLTVSRRLHSLIIRILHQRLQTSIHLADQNLIFECYHPSERATSPHRECDHLSTEILGPWHDADADAGAHDGNGGTDKVSQIRPVQLYSHFRPRRREARNGALMVETEEGTYLATRHIPAVVEQLSLEPHELFSQLCTATHLVTLGPRSDLFRTFVTVAEGTVRVWRDWLADRAADLDLGNVLDGDLGADDGDAPPAKASDGLHERILWVDTRRNFGMLVRVREGKWEGDHQPVLMQEDESSPVTYEVEIEGL